MLDFWMARQIGFSIIFGNRFLRLQKEDSPMDIRCEIARQLIFDLELCVCVTLTSRDKLSLECRKDGRATCESVVEFPSAHPRRHNRICLLYSSASSIKNARCRSRCRKMTAFESTIIKFTYSSRNERLLHK